jgi:hypothetical protein
LKDVDLSPLAKAWDSLWKLIQPLFAEHALLTILCIFFGVLMTLSFFRLLKSISPALVVIIIGILFATLLMHWAYTRSEPAFMKPVIDFIAPFFPSAPSYPDGTKKPAPGKQAPVPPRKG